MDTILELQHRKQEIEELNSLANMLISIRDAIEEYIAKVENGDKQTDLQVPFPCKFAMNLSGHSDIYGFIDTLNTSLSNYILSLSYNKRNSVFSKVSVRSYTGNDVSMSSWVSEITKLVSDIESWRRDVENRVDKAKQK